MAPVVEDERELEKFKQGLRKLIAYHREKLTRAETALAALEGKPARTTEPRLNKAIKDLLAKAGAARTREEIRAELMAAGIITDSITDRSRLDRSLRQCVNAHTLAEVAGKFAVPAE
jgi:hypothetical protein